MASLVSSPAAVASRYLVALEQRAPVATIADLLHDQAVIEVLPNLLAPRGSRRARAEALADVERGRALLVQERYAITASIEQGERAVLEVTWTGVLAVALGKLAPDSPIRARCAMCFEVRDGRILSQRNYDCFDPIGQSD